MSEIDPQQSFEEAARLLVELQGQLKEYKSLVDTLNDLSSRSDSVESAAGNLAEAVQNLTPMVTALQQTRESLKTSLELTFQTLNHSQEKAREYQEAFEATGEKFSRDMEELSGELQRKLSDQLEKRTAEVGSELEQLFKKPESVIAQNFQWLKYLGIANLVFLAILLLSFWLRSPEAAGPAPGKATVEQLSGPEGNTGRSNPAESNQAAVGEVLKVQILNGCGVSGIAARFQSYLVGNGFEVQDTDNAEHFDYPNTRIEVKAPAKLAGERIAQLLRLSPLMVQDYLKQDHQYDVVIILGKDYRRLNPYTQN